MEKAKLTSAHDTAKGKTSFHAEIQLFFVSDTTETLKRLLTRLWFHFSLRNTISGFLKNSKFVDALF